jgi:hypothetical protein
VPDVAAHRQNGFDSSVIHLVERVFRQAGKEKSLLPEALPTLLAGITLTIVMLIGFSSMAGVIGLAAGI